MDAPLSHLYCGSVDGRADSPIKKTTLSALTSLTFFFLAISRNPALEERSSPRRLAQFLQLTFSDTNTIFLEKCRCQIFLEIQKRSEKYFWRPIALVSEKESCEI